MEPERPVRVLIVDDQVLMREGLRTLLELEAGVEVAGTAINGSDAIEQVKSCLPDVVLMDLRMPVMDGIAATTVIRGRHPDVQILVLTTFDDDESIMAALQAGAAGYVLKDTPSEQLARDIRAVHRGDGSLSPSVAQKVIARLVARDAPAAPRPAEPRIDAAGRERLSERELDVLRLAGEGLNRPRDRRPTLHNRRNREKSLLISAIQIAREGPHAGGSPGKATGTDMRGGALTAYRDHPNKPTRRSPPRPPRRVKASRARYSSVYDNLKRPGCLDAATPRRRTKAIGGAPYLHGGYSARGPVCLHSGA